MSILALLLVGAAAFAVVDYVLVSAVRSYMRANTFGAQHTLRRASAAEMRPAALVTPRDRDHVQVVQSNPAPVSDAHP